MIAVLDLIFVLTELFVGIPGRPKLAWLHFGCGLESRRVSSCSRNRALQCSIWPCRQFSYHRNTEKAQVIDASQIRFAPQSVDSGERLHLT